MKKLPYYKIGAIACGIVVAIAVLWWLKGSVEQTEVSVEVDDRINLTPEQIESIKAIGQWEFLSVADEQMVDTVRKGFFSDDHLVRIYYGTVRLGIDLQKVDSGWINTSGDSISVTLPRITLLDRDFIDEARTKSFHESGRWKPKDREALYQRARRKMLAHCMTPKNMDTARKNGEAQFRQMMRSMGFEHVAIDWER
jgi:hypothetical protein